MLSHDMTLDLARDFFFLPKDEKLRSSEVLLTLFACLFLIVSLVRGGLFSSPSPPSSSSSFNNLPCINDHPGDQRSRQKAQYEFVNNGPAMIWEGVKRYPDQPFRVITGASKEKVILPHSYIEWLRKHPDLTMKGSLSQEFFTDYPGFEGLGSFQNDDSHFLINTVKRRMTKVTQKMLDTFDRQIEMGLSRLLGDSQEPRNMNVHKLCHDLIPLVNSAVFCGEELAQEPRWLALVGSYTLNMVNAARALRMWHPLLRPIVHWFLPECRLCRRQVYEARQLFSGLNVNNPKLADTAFAWTKDSPRYDASSLQLGLAFASTHTMGELLAQIVLDLALASSSDSKHPTLIADLRKEIQDVTNEAPSDEDVNGVDVESETITSSSGKRDKARRLIPQMIHKLALLDACIKETQRFKTFSLLGLERASLSEPVTLPDGTTIISKGTQVCIPSHHQWSEELWGDDASVWNPYRFVHQNRSHPNDEKDLQETNKEESLSEEATSNIKDSNTVTVSPRHYGFGWGKSTCPGRFFAVAEIKVILVKLLTGWDLNLNVPTESEMGEMYGGGGGCNNIDDDKIKRNIQVWKESGRVPYLTFGMEPISDPRIDITVSTRSVMGRRRRRQEEEEC